MGINFRDVSRGLRTAATKAETRLWEELRNRQFLGLKFVRQSPIPYQINEVSRVFIADFYCHEHKLVIELDGEIHSEQIEKDSVRDFILKTKGLRVLRIKNRDILKDTTRSLQNLKDEVLKLSEM